MTPAAFHYLTPLYSVVVHGAGGALFKGLACYSNRSLEQFKPLRSVSVGDYVASFFFHFFAKVIVCFLGVSDALQIPPRQSIVRFSPQISAIGLATAEGLKASR